MKVLIIGSHSHLTDQERRIEFISACRDIGDALATRGHEVVVGSDTDHTADRHVVDGMAKSGRTCSIFVVRPRTAAQKKPFEGTPGLKVKHEVKGQSLADSHRFALEMADALLLIGGTRSGMRAGLVASAVSVPRIPLKHFGGNAQILYEAFRLDPMWRGPVRHAQFLEEKKWQSGYGMNVVRLLERLETRAERSMWFPDAAEPVKRERFVALAEQLEEHLPTVQTLVTRALELKNSHPPCCLNSIRTIEEKLVRARQEITNVMRPSAEAGAGMRARTSQNGLATALRASFRLNKDFVP